MICVAIYTFLGWGIYPAAEIIYKTASTTKLLLVNSAEMIFMCSKIKFNPKSYSQPKVLKLIHYVVYRLYFLFQPVLEGITWCRYWNQMEILQLIFFFFFMQLCTIWTPIQLWINFEVDRYQNNIFIRATACSKSPLLLLLSEKSVILNI